MSILPLKKQSSTFTLPNSPTPISPPLLPSTSQSDCDLSCTKLDVFNKPMPIRRKSTSRPTTASSHGETTPWQYQSSLSQTRSLSPINDNFAKTPNLDIKNSSTKSKPSSVKSTQMSGTSAGLIEDVSQDVSSPESIPEINHFPTSESTPVLNIPPSITARGSVKIATPLKLVPSPSYLQEHTTKNASSSSSIPLDCPYLPSSDLSSSSRKQSSLSITHSHGSTSSQVTKTGPTEDVTPWELQPGPDLATLEDSEGTRTSRLGVSLTLAQVEAVTPWELHSAPPPLDDNSRITISSEFTKKSSGNAWSDISSVPTRKQGSNQHQKKHPNDSHQFTKPPHLPVQYISVSAPQGQNSDSQTSSLGGAVQPSASVISKVSVEYMSTADRKTSQPQFFQVKGKGHHQHGGGVTPGKIHHAYDEKKAPYPRSYGTKIQDLDIWDSMMCYQICNSWTWHAFKEPPKAVLDVGCGTGLWITHAANTWKECHFWGIDLVPTQPNLTILGTHDLNQRIHWVHHNFLEGLPFENEIFDYIHIKRVGLGVPEDKWDPLFEECKRVLKPGGAFEIIEEDLFFPGKPTDSSEISSGGLTISKEEYEILSVGNSTTHNDSSANRSISMLDTASPTNDNGKIDRFSTIPAIIQTPFMKPLLSDHCSPETSALASKSTNPSASDDITTHDEDTSLSSRAIVSLDGSQASMPRSQFVSRSDLSTKIPSSSYSTTSPRRSVISLIHLPGHNTSTSEHTRSAPKLRTSNVTKDSNPQGPLSRTKTSSSHETQSQASAEGHLAHNGKLTTERESYLLRQYKAPLNPRDHTILETIYAEMLASRFINTNPLSIIQNYLEYHFFDVRTHPPLLLTFPHTALLHSGSRYVMDSESETESSDEFSSDGEVRDAIRPKPPKTRIPKESLDSCARLPRNSSIRSRYRCTLGKSSEYEPSGPRFLSFPHLIQRQSPYVFFDESRGYSFSPATHSNRRSVDGNPSGPVLMPRLPNSNLNIDIKTLNTHLCLRMMEILECSESMWEWVIQYQLNMTKGSDNGAGKHTTSQDVNHPMRSKTSLNSTSSINSNESVMDGIAEMTRDDFEMLLVNFEFDMQDQASVDLTLQEQSDWHVFASPRDFRRQAFDDACKKWDKWVRKQENRARYLAYHPSRALRNYEATLTEHCNGMPPTDLDSPSIVTTSGYSVSLNGKCPTKQDFLGMASLGSSSLPPFKRLSRALRVFCAWKPQDPHSPNQAVPTHHTLVS